MVNLMTKYDSTLKDKIFVLKGDESYVRTTDTLLNLTNYDDSSILNMTFDMELNVLRDIGESNIIVYDNDEVLYSIEWSDTPSEITFPDGMTWDGDKLIISDVSFNYDEEHDVYARYMGSNQCRLSTSKHYPFNVPTPDKFTSTIRNTGSVSFDADGVFSINTRVTFSSPVEVERPYNIDMYVDGELYHTYKGNITANATILNREMYVNQDGMPILSQGKHHVRLRYRGDEYTTASEIEYDISLGYIITLDSYDTPFVPSQQWFDVSWNHVTVKLINHLNNPVTDESINLVLAPTGTSSTIVLNGDTDDNGLITYYLDDWGSAQQLISMSNSIDVYAVTRDTNEEYITETVTVPVYSNQGLTVSASRSIIAPNMETEIRATLDTPHKNVPVYFGEDIGTLYTNEEGVASFIYTGDGGGMKTFTATLGSEIWNGTSVEDYLQYWDYYWNAVYNQQMTAYNSYFNVQSNQILIKPVQYNRGYVLLTDENVWLAGGCSWVCEFDVVSVTYSVPFIQSQQLSNLKKGDKVRLVKVQKEGETSTIRIYVNNSLVTERSQTNESDGYPMIGVAPNNQSKLSNASIGINNLKLSWYPIGTDPDGA